MLITFLYTGGFAQNTTGGLVGYYTFCDCAATDISGNNHHGTIVGGSQCVRGMRDYGLLLNQTPGSNGCGQRGGQYIQLPDFGPIWANGFTVCAWVRFDEIKNFERIIDFGNSNGEAGGLPIWFGREGNTNTLTLESWINSDGAQARAVGRLTAPNAITNGRIEYYCATISGNTMRIYVNGVLKAERQGNGIANVSRKNNFIGRSNWCANDPDFKGFLDEVRIYNRALSADEIKNLYQVTNVDSFTATTTCNSLEVAFSIANTRNIDSLIWDFGEAASGPLNKASGATASHRFTSSGSYTVRLIAFKACFNDTVIKTVAVHEGVTVSLGPDFSFCPTSPKQLGATIDRASYQWQDGSTINSRQITLPGLYWLQVTLDGCSYRDSVTATSLRKTSSQTVSICSGQSYDGYSRSGFYSDTFALANGCDSIRTLSLTVQTRIFNSIAKTICQGESYMGYHTSGIYSDTLRYASGCDSVIRSIQLTVNLLPDVTVSKTNDVDCTIGTTKLSATGGTSYVWWPAATLSDAFSSNPVASPVMTTTYWVRAAKNGCSAEDSITVVANADGTQNSYPVPNAFTPNGDGINDCFGVRYWGTITRFSLRIYNRWGATIFSSNDVSRCWDGRYKGQRVESGGYVYLIRAGTKCGDVLRKGVVIVIR